jgi:hypothetical protein
MIQVKYSLYYRDNSPDWFIQNSVKTGFYTGII